MKINHKYKNLSKLSRIRRIAETIESQKFQIKYREIINPILDCYRQKIAFDFEMRDQIINAIKKIKRLAINNQYIENNPPRPNRRNYKKPDFSQHSKLLRLEKICEEKLLSMEIKI